MRGTALLTLVGAVMLVAPAAASPLAFRTPGEFDAEWAGVNDATWALLIFRGDDAAAFEAMATTDADLWTETASHPVQVEDGSGDTHTPYKDRDNSTQPLAGPFDLKTTFVPVRNGSMFVVAERIELNLHGFKGVLGVKEEGVSVGTHTTDQAGDDELYRGGLAAAMGRSVMVAATAKPENLDSTFNLIAHGATQVEWYNAQVRCFRASPCPTGGGPEVMSIPGPAGYELRSERHTYEALLGTEIELHGAGAVNQVIFGSGELTLGVLGSVRLPLATGSGQSCEGCVLPSNQTFAATGNITLSHLTAQDGGLQADVDGELETARFDEISVDPAAVLGLKVGAVAVGGGLTLFFGFKLLSGLFTRHKEEGPLANERRRRLYEFVKANPGTHFREALRGADVPAGSGRHHLTKLVLAGLLVERRHRNSVYLFENHGRFDATWQGLAALSDPDQRLLHDWLRANPESPQKAIVGAFARSHGWARSATQGRLERLIREGVVEARVHGRFKLYSAVQSLPAQQMVIANDSRVPLVAARPA